MKSICYLVLLSPLIVLLTSCPNPGTPAPTGTMNVQIDGHNWTATGFQISDYGSGTARNFYMRAYNVSSKFFIINIYGLKDTGTYPIAKPTGGAVKPGIATVSYYDNNSGDAADTGQITITKLTDKSAAGTISLVTTNGIKVTDGTFSVFHN